MAEAQVTEGGAPRAKAAETRGEILQAAARLFAQRGYADCSLRELAEAVGMKAGSFYYHFSAKEEILDALIEDSARQLTDAIDTELAALPPEATALLRLETALRAQTAVVLSGEGPAALLTLWERLPASLKARRRDLRRAHDTRWQALVSDAQQAGELRSDLSAEVLARWLDAQMARAADVAGPGRKRRAEAVALVVSLALNGALHRP